jgi:CHAT domain-containing protein/tetratricopeptide (TPR) repeat protein
MHRWSLMLLSALLVPLSAWAQDAARLLLAVPLERRLAPAHTDSFRVPMSAGQYARIVVEQKGVDVVVRVSGPDGKLLFAADSPNDDWGPEPASWIAPQSGSYLVTVAGSTTAASSGGPYRIELIELRPPSESDRTRIEAERTMVNVMFTQSAVPPARSIASLERAASLWRLLNEKDEEALCIRAEGLLYNAIGQPRKAIEYERRAQLLFHAAHDADGEAGAIGNIGFVYQSMGQPRQAVDYLERAERLLERTSDLHGRAGMLISLGRAYRSLGENKKALQAAMKAAPLLRAAGDGDGEAAALSDVGSLYRLLSQPLEAIAYYQQALPLARAAHDASGEAATLGNMGDAYSAVGDRERALDSYRQALPLLDAAGNRAAEATTLADIGLIYVALGDARNAMESLEKAAPLLHAAGNTAVEAVVLSNLGYIYGTLGREQKALECDRHALGLLQASGDRSGAARVLNNIGMVYDALGERTKALDSYRQALPISRAARDRAGEAATLNNLGKAYGELGQSQTALDNSRQALAIFHELADRAGEARALANIGLVYSLMGQAADALAYDRRALSLAHVAGDRVGEATTLMNIGSVYQELDDLAEAVRYFGQALPLFQALRSPPEEAVALNNLGGVYSRLGKKQKALEYYRQALQIAESGGHRSVEAGTLNNIGSVYADLGDKQKALEFYERALPLCAAAGDRSTEARVLNNIAGLCEESGDNTKALDDWQQALTAARASGDRGGEAVTLANLSSLFHDLHLPDGSILLGKQAVNVLQSIRRDNQRLPEYLRHSYAKSVGNVYRFLAGLLIEHGRLGEAEEVLDLLKDKEAAEYIRRDAVSDQLRPMNLLPFEKKALERYDQIAARVVSLGQERAALLAKRESAPLSAAEIVRAGALDRDLAAANTVLLRYLSEEEKTTAPDSHRADRIEQFREAEGIQDALAKLGPGVVAIYTLVMPDKYIAMLVTSGARKVYVTPIAEADLNRNIADFRQALRNPASDPLPIAQALYRIVFPDGLRQDLDSMHAQTIMWSVDNALRYVPIAALHDGREYLVERFRNSLITPASLARLTESPAPLWQGEGFGVSRAEAGFAALPSVPVELRGIFRQTAAGTAPIEGVIRLNRDFTRQTFENDLRGRRNRVVHIATHFDSRSGVAADSHLLLGDGTELSLADIEAQTRLFDGVDLLTLSACNTAFKNMNQDGREVDTLGTIAQRLGALGVVASLWSVDDESTARLMQAMYTFWEKHPELGKSEALRRAQAEMASGALRPAGGTGTDGRGARALHTDTVERDWRHPYYWAPFILIGNWK